LTKSLDELRAKKERDMKRKQEEEAAEKLKKQQEQYINNNISFNSSDNPSF